MGLTDSAVQLGDIEVLLAIEQIRLLKARYFQAVDEKDYGAIAAIFTDDAPVDFSGEAGHHAGHHGVALEGSDPDAARVVGGAEAARIIKNAVDAIVTVHHGHDPQIVLTGPDSATGRWQLYDRMEYADEIMHGFGTYDETYRRAAGAWQIASLSLSRKSVEWTPTK